MPKPAKLLFLLTDGGRARFVERLTETGRFVTFEELDHTERLRALREELRASPPARAFSSASPRRSSVGAEDYIRPAKEAFMGEVAERAGALVRARGLDGVVLAAPTRLIGPLRVRVARCARVTGAIRKDLTKAPDHDLGGWLNEAARSPLLSL